MRSNSKRALLLEAAARIVKEEGAAKLTLDAVAQEAGVSKGGLLHHFASKEALIKGLVEHITDTFVADMEGRVKRDQRETGKWSRAYVASTFQGGSESDGLTTALIAALFAKPELLGRFREQYDSWQNEIQSDGMDPVLSTIIRLATDGLWFAELFGFGLLDDGLRSQVQARLTQWTEGEART
ncbi:TetR family transcriptional regulator [Paenibacillus agaridevorans]|uniref:TetR family transcriptional regulator n=1 Tax=Paenibacillus agaridevorans TaxID=171404 RepID=A0A2R5F4I1_9BACL|nr:TetR/AcrR family transcriptional regulator [Paenibacillus agaridevorans]GBG11014.1 TetR family transcriptional regulator [Paenibacillus agaridevorans]